MTEEKNTNKQSMRVIGLCHLCLVRCRHWVIDPLGFETMIYPSVMQRMIKPIRWQCICIEGCREEATSPIHYAWDVLTCSAIGLSFGLRSVPTPLPARVRCIEEGV